MLEFFFQVINTYDTDNNKAVDLVYLDFQKAFNKVPHERVMVEVNAQGIQLVMQQDGSGTYRIQRVCINQSYSNWAPVTSGVPQGSVSGPLLFLIYINDRDTNNVSKISKFSDDIKLCYGARNPDDIMELQEDISTLVEWANRWQMNFNVDKFSMMHIGHNNMQGNYNMSNQQLQATDQQQDLGIIITKDLKWQKQTEKSCKTSRRVLGLIARNSRYKNKELILPLYESLIRPHLEHAVQFWSPRLRRDIDKIEKIQKRTTKIIQGIRNHS